MYNTFKLLFVDFHYSGKKQYKIPHNNLPPTLSSARSPSSSCMSSVCSGIPSIPGDQGKEVNHTCQYSHSFINTAQRVSRPLQQHTVKEQLASAFSPKEQQDWTGQWQITCMTCTCNVRILSLIQFRLCIWVKWENQSKRCHYWRLETVSFGDSITLWKLMALPCDVHGSSQHCHKEGRK